MMIDQLEPKIAQVVRANTGKLGIDPVVHTLELTKLGVGEANLNVLVHINNTHKRTFRLCIRPDLDGNPRKEFLSLSRLPPGLGPKPYLLDDSRAVLPYPFLVLSFVEGSHVHEWTREHFVAHGQKLARLHRQKYELWGEIGNEQSTPFELHGSFLAALEWWTQHYPALFDIPEVSRLVPKLEAFFRRKNHLSVTRSSLVHGDLTASNILFAGAEPHYIDWEWLSLSDSAIDVTQIGWDIAVPPWQFALTAKQLNWFLASYQALLPDETLRERREVWMVSYKFFDHLHYRSKFLPSGSKTVSELPAQHYLSAIERVYNSLATQFL